MKWILFLVLLRPFAVLACLPNEIHIREQWISEYTKEDGTIVSGHRRSEHCRGIEVVNYFQDSSSKKFKKTRILRNGRRVRNHF